MTCPNVEDDCGKVVVVGDLSSDGIDDIVIGAPLADGENDAKVDAGEIYIVYGAADLPAAFDIADFSGVNILYGTVEDGMMGYEIVLVDADDNGTMELAADLYNNTSLLYSFDFLTVLGRNLKLTKVALSSDEATMAEPKVMLNLKLAASTDEDLTINSITVTASGTGRDDVQVSEVLLYEDVNGNGELDDGDRQIGENMNYEEDNGKIAFTNLSETISAGSQQYWMVVYRFVYIKSTSVSMMTNSNDAGASGIFLGTIFNLSALSLAGLRRRRRMLKSLLTAAMLFVIPLLGSACGDNFSMPSFDKGTLTIKASIADPSDISVTSESGGTVEIIGSEIEGDEVKVHIYAEEDK
jgi:hypothetical protein